MPAPPPEQRETAGTLRRLDVQVVTALQRGTRRLVRAAGWPFRLLRRAEDRLAPRLVRRVARGWRVPAFLTGLIVLLGAGVHLERYPEIRDARRQAEVAASEQSVRVPGRSGASEASDAGSTGPRLGADVERYVAGRRGALAELPGVAEALAVVSFDGYLTPSAVAELLPDGLAVRRAQYRLPAEGERPLETEVVNGDLVGSMDRAVEAALGPIVDEIGEVRTLLGSDTIDDPAFEEDLERRLSELETIRNLVDSAPAVVFAIVVEGPGDVLRALAEHKDVRLVDPVDGGADPDVAVFYGLLPEDRTEVTFGRLA